MFCLSSTQKAIYDNLYTHVWYNESENCFQKVKFTMHLAYSALSCCYCTRWP